MVPGRTRTRPIWFVVVLVRVVFGWRWFFTRTRVRTNEDWRKIRPADTPSRDHAISYVLKSDLKAISVSFSGFDVKVQPAWFEPWFWFFRFSAAFTVVLVRFAHGQRWFWFVPEPWFWFLSSSMYH